MRAAGLELNTLWIGDRMPALQGLCLHSAVAVGCPVRLFTYGPVQGVPQGVEIADAREILGLDKMIRHRETQSVALFSDRFRYEILGKGLGAWFDTDMLFLKPPQPTAECLVGWESEELVGSGFIWITPGHRLITRLRRHAAREYPVPKWFPRRLRWELTYRKLMGRPVHVSELEWGVIGPDLLTWLLRDMKLIDRARPRSWCSPVPYEMRLEVVKGGVDWHGWIGEDTTCVHLWNQGLTRRERVVPPEAGSFLDHVVRQYRYDWPDAS